MTTTPTTDVPVVRELAERHGLPLDGGCAAAEATSEVRSVLDRVGDKWSVLVVTLLGDGPMRFSELQRKIDGQGRRIDISMLEAMTHFNLDSFTHYYSAGEIMGPLSRPVKARRSVEAVPIRLRMSEEDIARIRGPIGLDIGGQTPEEMAISILLSNGSADRPDTASMIWALDKMVPADSSRSSRSRG